MTSRTTPDTREFHIGDILSVTSGRLVSPDHIGGVYNLLGWMVDEDLMTHQLPRVSEECEGFLRDLFPDLAGVDASSAVITSEAECATWLASLEPDFGTHREVPRLPRVDHTAIDPITEIRLRRPDAQIITLGDLP